MTVKISATGWKEELVIETDKGKAKVSVQALNGALKIEGEEILEQVGMTVNDAILLFLDQAASQETRKRYANFLSHKKAT